MAKDPAVLWYWNDWQGGTSTFTRHLKGCYMDLLNAQFNNGRLSLAEIKTILGADFGNAWPTLQKKFTADESGMFFNERMEQEKDKRKKFTESRRRNLSVKKEVHMDEHMEPHMGAHMENVNEDENVVKDRGKGKGWNTRPGQECKDLVLPDQYFIAAIELFGISKNTKVSRQQVDALWRIFKIQNLAGKKYYASESDVFSHFINWCKIQDVKNIPPPEVNGESIKEFGNKEKLNALYGKN